MENILVTGATSGIGYEVIKLLAEKKNNIIFFARNEKKSSQLNNLLKEKYNVLSQYYICDFSDLKTVKKATEKLIKNSKKIDCIINNAGKVYFSYDKTKDGIERSFQINYLSHFYITEKLLEKNILDKNSQIINVSSVAHNPNSSINSLDSIKYKKLVGKMNFKDINYENEKFRGFTSLFYSRSKMAQIMWSYYRSRFLNGININSIHPGLLGSNVIFENGIFGKLLTPLFKLFFRSSKEGAKNILHVIEKVNNENITGKYFDERKISDSHEYSYNEDDQKELFDLSKKLLLDRKIF